MAQKVQVLLLCDLGEDDEDAQETMSFSLDRTQYEIDLCAKHARQIRDGLEPFIEHARRSSVGTATGQRRRRPTSNREHSSDIRSWAKDHGIHINERGRIPASVMKEYEQGH